MAKFNPETYDPSLDSSPGYAADATENVLVLVWHDGDSNLCHSGTLEPIADRKFFRQGGDARLKGKLVRAHLANVGVAVIEGGIRRETTAYTVADWMGPTWTEYLRQAEMRHKLGSEHKPRTKAATIDTVAAKTLARRAAARKGAATRRRNAAAKAAQG